MALSPARCHIAAEQPMLLVLASAAGQLAAKPAGKGPPMRAWALETKGLCACE